MFSSSRLKLALLLLAAASAALLAGCFEFGPSHAPAVALNTSSLDASCLHQTGQTVQDYLGQNLSGTGAINGFWDCLSHTTRLFTDRVRGQTPGRYSANEVRYFAESEFLPGVRISDALLSEAFELKRFLLGGDATSITPGEIARARALIETLRSQTLALYPALAALNHPGQNPGLERADQSLRMISEALLPWLTQSGAEFSFKHLDRFLTGLEEFVTESSIRSTIHSLRARLPLARVLKQRATASSDPDLISAQEWGTLLDLGRRTLFMGLKVQRLTQSGQSIFRGEGRKAFSQVVDTALGLAEQVVAAQPDKMLTFAQLDEILDGFDPSDLPVKQQTLKDFMRPLFQRYFGGNRPGVCGRDATGICLESLQRVSDFYRHWNFAQDYLETLYAHLDSAAGGGSQAGYFPADLLRPTLQELYGKPAFALDPLLVDAADEMRKIIINERPYYDHDDLRVAFLNTAGDRHTLFNQTQECWLHELIRLMMRAYVSHPAADVDQDAATYDDFEQMYLGIRELGREFKIMDGNSDAVLSQRFMEANLFMDASDGDVTMNMGEAVGLVAYLISSKQSSSDIHDEASARCPLGDIDSYGKPRIEFECFKRVYFEQVERWWERMPALLAEYRSLDASALDDFQKTFFMAAVGPSTYGKPLGAGDADSVAMIAHYLESIYTRFDTTRSGVLSLGEAEIAFPVFESKIVEVSKMHSRFQNLSLFTYLLAFGRPPTQNIGGALSLIAWEGRRPLWGKSVHADRRTLLHVFSALGSQPQ
jgi:hypothetical protein